MGEYLIGLILILAAGTVSSVVSERFRIPAGRLLGTLFSVAALSLAGYEIAVYPWMKSLAGALLGTFFGLKFTNEVTRMLRRLVRPAILIICWYVLLTLALGFLLEHVFLLDRTSALLASVPGGIAEVNILVIDYHADLTMVTTFQLSRYLSIVLLMTVLTIAVKRREGTSPAAVAAGSAALHETGTAAEYGTRLRKNPERFPVGEHPADSGRTGEDAAEGGCAGDDEADGNKTPERVLRWPLVLLLGGAGSTVFMLINFPAGSMIGALLFVALVSLLLPVRVEPPTRKLFHLAQILMGGIIGTGISGGNSAQLREIAPAVVVITGLIIGASFLFAFLLSRLQNLPFLTAFLAVVPGGLTPVMVLADDAGTDMAVVGTLQTVRLLTAVFIIPMLYALIL